MSNKFKINEIVLHNGIARRVVGIEDGQGYCLCFENFNGKTMYMWAREENLKPIDSVPYGDKESFAASDAAKYVATGKVFSDGIHSGA